MNCASIGQQGATTSSACPSHPNARRFRLGNNVLNRGTANSIRAAAILYICLISKKGARSIGGGGKLPFHVDSTNRFPHTKYCRLVLISKFGLSGQIEWDSAEANGIRGSPRLHGCLNCQKEILTGVFRHSPAGLRRKLECNSAGLF